MDGTLATVDQLFGTTPKRRFKLVTLPVSGLLVRIRSLTERELGAYQAETVAANGQGLRKARLEDAGRRLIALCLVDADGNRLLSPAQAAQLAEWDAADTQALYEECAAHVGVKRTDVEELVKNSERILVDGSPTG